MWKTPSVLASQDRRHPARLSRNCRHRDRVYIGGEDDLLFSRCTRCGALCMFRDGRMWAIPPAKPG